ILRLGLTRCSLATPTKLLRGGAARRSSFIEGSHVLCLETSPAQVIDMRSKISAGHYCPQGQLGNGGRLIRSRDLILSKRTFETFPLNKKADISVGLCSAGKCKSRSVARGHRCAVTAKAVVDAQGDHVHVLADPVVEYAYQACVGHGEGVVGISHPQMVVFSAERAVRGISVLKSDTQGAAPARRSCRDQTDARGVVEYGEAIVGHRRAAFDVEQCRIPSPTDLAREKADGISFHVGRERRVEHADASPAEVRPIALCFQSEHKLVGLPAIPDLPAEEASGTIAATADEICPGCIKEIHATMALSPAAICADVEAAPIVDRSHYRRWCRLNRHVSSQGWRSYAQRNQTNCTQQDLLHCNPSCAVVSDTKHDFESILGPRGQKPRAKLATLK